VLNRWGDEGGEEKACLVACEAMKILEKQE